MAKRDNPSAPPEPPPPHGLAADLDAYPGAGAHFAAQPDGWLQCAHCDYRANHAGNAAGHLLARHSEHLPPEPVAGQSEPGGESIPATTEEAVNG